MPTASPLVLRQVTELLPVEVVHPDSVTPAAVSDNPVPLPVAAVFMRRLVALVMELIVAFAGMFGPEIDMPGQRFAVLLHVTVVVPFVVQFVSTMGTVRFPVPLRCFTSVALRFAVAVHALMAPASPLAVDPFENVSRHTVFVVCTPVL
jgi:hypothetical protein